MIYHQPVAGVHSIPEIHTSHKHIVGFEWHVGETLRHAWKYQSGQEPPNYPMPAIPTEIDIQSKWVVMFQWVGPEMNGNYITETMLAIADDCFFGPID